MFRFSPDTLYSLKVIWSLCKDGNKYTEGKEGPRRTKFSILFSLFQFDGIFFYVISYKNFYERSTEDFELLKNF